METIEKLGVLADSAKYDVACTSSGTQRSAGKGQMGSAALAGICHSFSADGRCISLLKVLLSNACIYDCQYCVNRRSSDIPRATFTPRELADLTIGFYKRNYIEGLFLSSAVVKNPDYTCEQMLRVLHLLRKEYHFSGYIHAKAIPGADPLLLTEIGLLADRMSVNIEMPSEKSLRLFAPDKTRQSILAPMGFMAQRLQENKQEMVLYRNAPKFTPAGHSTQMIVGASGENDFQILRLTEGLYQRYKLKRVFFSGYIPVASSHALLPPLGTKPPMLREHRLYQADWLLRFYHFSAEEILDDDHPNFSPYMDPKCNWALRHPERFPIEVNKASYKELLRVPGVGVRSAQRIVAARYSGALDFSALQKLGVVLKRAQYFIVCKGKLREGLVASKAAALSAMMSPRERKMYLEDGFSLGGGQQLSLIPPEHRATDAWRKTLCGEL